MDLAYSDEQQAAIDLARQILGDHCTPQALRAREAKPNLQALHAWMTAQRSRTPDGGGLARAIDYSLKR